MIGAIIGGVASLAGSIFGGGKARRASAEAAKEKSRLEAKLNSLEKNRQKIINPYEGITDLSSMISNPFTNLSVATGAAEMQIEEADISLANTLDAMRATGAGAGGATALAQAALQAKKDVSANIEMQEKSNEDKRAQGEAQMQQQKMTEAQRLQEADVSGKAFVFGQKEQREMQQLDRAAAQLGAATQAKAQASADATASTLGGISAIGQIGSALFAKKGPKGP